MTEQLSLFPDQPAPADQLPKTQKKRAEIQVISSDVTMIYRFVPDGKGGLAKVSRPVGKGRSPLRLVPLDDPARPRNRVKSVDSPCPTESGALFRLGRCL